MEDNQVAIIEDSEVEVEKPEENKKPRLNYRMKRMLLYIQEHPFDDMDTIIKKMKIPQSEEAPFINDYLSKPFQSYLNSIKTTTDDLLEKASVEATFKVHELLSSENENIRLKAGMGLIYARNKIKHPDKLVFQIKNMPQILNQVVIRERKDD